MADDEKKPAPKAAGKKTAEEWKKLKASSEWNYSGAKGLKDWPTNMELTEKEYDDSLSEFAAVVLR
jgi:hypothetical protein